MYWTWQSGYINAKLEGKSNLVNTPTHAFAFHLGGYLNPFQTLQTISIPCTTKDKLTIFDDFNNLYDCKFNANKPSDVAQRRGSATFAKLLGELLSPGKLKQKHLYHSPFKCNCPCV